MPSNFRKGTIVFSDNRDLQSPKSQTIDIIQLNDTYKNQPRDNVGPFIHIAPDSRIHVDVYLSPGVKEEADVRVTASLGVSGDLVSGASLTMTSGQAFGFAGSIAGVSGDAGILYAVLSDSSLILSSNDQVFGSMVVGSTMARQGSLFVISSLSA